MVLELRFIYKISIYLLRLWLYDYSTILCSSIDPRSKPLVPKANYITVMKNALKCLQVYTIVTFTLLNMFTGSFFLEKHMYIHQSTEIVQ